MSGRGAGYWTAIRRRPRLLIAVGLGLIGYVVTPWDYREATRALVGWNVGAWGFIGADLVYDGELHRGRRSPARG